MNEAWDRRIRRIVRRVAWAHHRVQEQDADDLAQAILVVAWKRFGNRAPAAIWIERATHLQCLMMLRRRRRRDEREKEYVRRRLLERPAPSTSEQHLDLKIALEAALHSKIGDELDPAGETLADIAARYSVPAGTLYRRLWQMKHGRRA